MREVELTLVVCETAGEHDTSITNPDNLASHPHSAVAAAILARFNRFCVNFQAIKVKLFPYLPFPRFDGPENTCPSRNCVHIGGLHLRALAFSLPKHDSRRLLVVFVLP